MQNKNKIGIYGLGAMGRNIALNIADKGFLVSVYNRNIEGEFHIVEDFLSTEAPSNVQGFNNVKEFVLSLEQPRKVLIMITSGSAVDEAICQIMPYMDSNDIIIDGGNSNYLDTKVRVEKYDVRYLGCGISGGWYGALNGPSMMIGGSNSAWNETRYLFQLIASKRNNHNDISSVFEEWNNKELNSYLMKVSSEVLLIKDKSGCLIDNVIDRSSQKGTGIDFAICALKYGVPAPTIIESINARFVSSSEYRINTFSMNSYKEAHQSPNVLLEVLFDSVYCSYVIAFFQGMDLVQKVSDDQSWNIDLMDVAAVWEEGCIIKSEIFKDLAKYLESKLSVQMLLEKLTKSKVENLSKAIGIGMENGVPMPVFSSSLNYYYSTCSNKLPANLIQLQREYFGSHGFEKIEAPGRICHFGVDLDI